MSFNKKTLDKLTGLRNEMVLDVLKSISNDYDLDLNELKDKYIDNNKKKSKRKKKTSGYNMFLADIDFDTKLKTENPNITFGELSKLKGAAWSSLTVEEKERWNNFAKMNQESNNKDENVFKLVE